MAKVSLRAYNREIEAMIDRNHLDEAVAHCQHILKTFPKHVETYRLLGKAYLEARRHDEAVDVFTRVLAAVPNDFVAHVGMSIVRDEQNKLDDAIWHMERAYEAQSANPAIQAELQRLYGRRDGVQPPRVRMTRGALAHMYMRGELYPQAISETRGVLEEDPGRSDMQVLLAKAYYRSGQKKDAADAASAVLKRYPFCLDANLVLAEILGADRPESAQGYRQRVIELDPYASQADNMFHAAEVSDAAISLDRLDWTGRPEGMAVDWGTANALRLESGREEQPEWMKSAYPDETHLSAPAIDSGLEASSQPALPADDIPDFLKAAGWGASTGAFDESKSSIFADESAPAAEPLVQGDLPDWIKAMKPAETSQPAEGQTEELPDWINKIGTTDLPVPSAETEEADWLGNLGEPATASQPSAEQPDWLKDFQQEEQPTSAPGAATEDLDWLKDLGQEEQAVPSTEAQPAPVAATEDLDWLKELGQEEQAVPSTEAQPAPTAEETPTWLKGLEQEEEPALATEETPAWLKGPGQEEEAIPAAEEEPDWLKGFQQEEQLLPASESQPDWLKDLPAEEPTSSQLIAEFDFSAETTGATPGEEVPFAAANTGSLGVSEKDQDDSFAWLEALAAKQGATEGLLTTPEERLEEEPDWVKQAKGSHEAPRQPVEEAPVMEAVTLAGGESETVSAEPEAGLEQPEMVEDTQPTRVQQRLPVEAEAVPAVEPPSAPTASAEELGKSETERDDSFAWLESLAAKQGATEGLLTKPEERLDQEPEWVRKLKSAGNALKPAPAPQKPAEKEIGPEPVSQLEVELPAEETVPAAPEPVSQLEVELLAEAAAPAEPEPVSQPAGSVEELGRSEAERDDSFAWLEALAAKQGATEGLLTKPEERLEQEPEWVKQVKKTTGELRSAPAQVQPVEEEPVTAEFVPEPEMTAPTANAEELGRSEAERDDSFAWLEALAAKQGATEGLLTKPEERLEQEPEWVRQAKELKKEAPAEPESAPQAEDVPAWLEGLGEEKEAEPAPMAENETTAWLRSLDEAEGEPVTVAPAEDLPAWMQEIGREEAPVAEPAVPMEEAESPAESAPEELPAWLHGLVEEEQAPAIPVADDLPAWMRDETGEVVAEPTKIEPTRSSDWAPLDEMKAEAVEPPLPAPQPAPEPKAVPAPKAKKPKKESVKPAAPEPYREPVTTIRGTGMLSMPVDPLLASARIELSRSNIPGALDTYGKLIKKGRFLEEVIFDLREALYRYPVEVSIWQALGDAYMRANRLQDALDAYTKAEELLR